MAAETTDLRHEVSTAHHPALVSTAVVARRAMRGAAVWGVAFGLMTLAIVNEFAKEYPTPADLARLVKTMASDVGSRAIFGPAHHLDTVGGYEAYHAIAIFGIIGAVWGLLAATRLLRGEEEEGRLELLLAGQTTRGRAAAAAMTGLGVGLLTLWAVSAAAVIAVGRAADPPFSVSASLFTAVAVVSSAAMFLAVGAVCSQLAATRRQAAGMAAAVFGVVYLIRVIAYSGTTLRWLHWVSPLGWVDELRPLTGSRPLALVPIVAFIVVLVAVAFVLAGKRDLGASVLPTRDTAPPRIRFLNDPLGLAHRLEHRTAFGWIAGLGTGGFLLGLSTKSIQEVWANQSGGFVQRLGGGSGAAAYLGLLFLVVALLAGMVAAGQAAATRDEEAQGYLDNLLVRPVSRVPWLAGRFAVSAVVLVGAGLATGLFTWLGAASTGFRLSLATMLAAGINVVPVGIFVLGIGTLAHGIAPRQAGAVAYGVVAWSFLVEIVGASLGASRWLLDVSILHHIARAPAADVRWGGDIALTLIGVAAAAVGAIALARRDLKGE